LPRKKTTFGLPALPRLPGIAKGGRPRSIKRDPKRRTGPRIYKLQADPLHVGGPGDPPEGFVGAHNSITEWIWYWASATVLKTPKDPRKMPFIGGLNWEYQVSLDGGRLQRGGTVCDFVYQISSSLVCVRIQSSRYHVAVDSAKQVQDFELKVHTGITSAGVDWVVDTYEEEWVSDTTGESACRALVNALKGEDDHNPIRFGVADRIH
jgi:hypothetical protein